MGVLGTSVKRREDAALITGKGKYTDDLQVPGMTYAAIVPMVWLTGFDTGVVFMRTADFRAVGGYDERRPFAEDLALLLALWRHGRRGGRRLVRLRRIKAVASTLKFDEHGEWHYFTMIARAGLELVRPGSLDAFADRYWYRPRR